MGGKVGPAGGRARGVLAADGPDHGNVLSITQDDEAEVGACQSNDLLRHEVERRVLSLALQESSG